MRNYKVTIVLWGDPFTIEHKYSLSYRDAMERHAEIAMKSVRSVRRRGGNLRFMFANPNGSPVTEWKF